jgi:hypothetical protein
VQTYISRADRNADNGLDIGKRAAAECPSTEIWTDVPWMKNTRDTSYTGYYDMRLHALKWLRCATRGVGCEMPTATRVPFAPLLQRLSSGRLESPASSLKGLRHASLDEGC